MKRALLLVALCAGVVVPARATPLACASPCSISVVSSTFYNAPVVEIANGTSVVWSSGQESHPTSDTTNPDAFCYSVDVTPNVTPEPVTFDVRDGTLYATQPAAHGVEAGTRACSSAFALPTGGYAVMFRCLVHPYMIGELIVDAP